MAEKQEVKSLDSTGTGWGPWKWWSFELFLGSV